MKFRTQAGTPVGAQPAQEANTKHLTLTGQGTQTQTIEAYVAYEDTTGTQEQVLGKLKLVSYNETANQLVVVPLGEATAPNAATLEQNLNDIYKSALATWDVTVESPMSIPQEQWDVKEEDGELGYGKSFFSNYSREMRKIYKYYEDQREDMEDGKHYLFLTDFPVKGNIVAYMPFDRKQAFVSAEEVASADLPRVIAHELGTR